MAEPDWNPDTAGRPLAEILREAGIDTSRAARRRRWDDPDDTGIPQRRPDAPDDGLPGGFARRSSDLPTSDPAARERRAARPEPGRPARDGAGRPDPGRSDPGRGDGRSPGRTDGRRADSGRVEGGRADSGRIGVERRTGRPAPEPSTAAIPGLRPSRQPEVPGTAGSSAGSAAPAPRNRRTADRTPQRGAGDAPERSPRSGPQRSARTATDDVPEARGPGARAAAGRFKQRTPEDEHFSTGPIPVVRDGDAMVETGEDAGPKEGALAWLRFAGELLIALAVGVGVYFLATVLWEQVPYLTVFLAPLAVTGLVGAVSLWRQRLGRGAMGTRLLAVLVFAGALLTVAPAAELIGGG